MVLSTVEDMMTVVEQLPKKENALTIKKEIASEETIVDFHMKPVTEMAGGQVCGIVVVIVGVLVEMMTEQVMVLSEDCTRKDLGL